MRLTVCPGTARYGAILSPYVPPVLRAPDTVANVFRCRKVTAKQNNRPLGTAMLNDPERQGRAEGGVSAAGPGVG